MTKTYYIGLGVTYHDPALAIVGEGGEVLFAEATERFLQNKRAINCEPDQLYQLPQLLRTYCKGAVRFVLGFNWRFRRPFYENLMAILGVLSPRGVMRQGIKRLRSPLKNYQIHHMMACNRQALKSGGLNLIRMVGEMFPEAAIELHDFDHHTCHAAYACYASPFAEAACAVVDSYGEQGSLALFRFANGRLQRVHEAHGLGSLGLFYMKLTEWCGFDWLKGEEWKVMGLAPYGRLDEEFLLQLRALVRLEGLSFVHPQRTSFAALAKLDVMSRSRDAADVAHTGQFFFNELMGKLLRRFHELCGISDLVLAGGCALNSSFNGQILGTTPFQRLSVPSAPADDGTALGAAWLAYAKDHPHWSPGLDARSPYLGATLSQDAVDRAISYGALPHRHLPESIGEETARLLADGKLVGWVQGRAEFGPRALGNRSILADPRDPGMKDRINGRVKFREEYRPFAPSVLHEHGPAYFIDYQESPYMERALKFEKSAVERVPAVVHMDQTGRLQSVTQRGNPRFHQLLDAFNRLTGVPILLNTSFNVMGKPIVHSVEDAMSVFMTSGLDALVLGDHLFTKPGSP